MKRFMAVVLVIFLLSGCAGADDTMDRVLALRQQALEKGCAFTATVTADYGEATRSFVLRCESDPDGSVRFQVLAPENISGITGTIDAEKGTLIFDDQVLAFDPLADGLLAPVTAPWVLVHTLRSGYIASCGKIENGLRLSIDDSYREDTLGLEIWLDEGDLPVSAEILWQGRRILSMRVENFRFL